MSTLEPATLTSLLLAGLGLSWLITAITRRAALRAQMLDLPNERSSHSRPTPRGGGIGFVAPFLGLALLLHLAEAVHPAFLMATIGAGALVASVGFIDDRGGLAARWRFLGHLLAAAWVVWHLWPLPRLAAFGSIFDLGPWAVPVAMLMVVWMVNLFNFMDGIDGIASVEAICVAVGGALAWWLAEPKADVAPALLFAACVTGFLIWNFPPARIFMGDVGSGFLGLVVALLALWSSLETPHVFWCWLILVGCFMTDATITLVRRVYRGEKFSEAHRSHAYQYASRRHGSHRTVTLGVLTINLLWLLPMACAVAIGWLDGVIAFVIAYVPLFWLAFRYKAGDRAGQGSAA